MYGTKKLSRPKIGDVIVELRESDESMRSEFLVEDYIGDFAIEIYCLNGAWRGIYDVDMKILEICMPFGKNKFTITHFKLKGDTDDKRI